MAQSQTPQKDSEQRLLESIKRQRRTRLILPLVVIIVGVVGFFIGRNGTTAGIDIFFGLVALVSVIWLVLWIRGLSDSAIQQESERRKNKAVSNMKNFY
jgi:hypothetical protein